MLQDAHDDERQTNNRTPNSEHTTHRGNYCLRFDYFFVAIDPNIIIVNDRSEITE